MRTSEARLAYITPVPLESAGEQELPSAWLAGLNRLEQACARHVEVDTRLRTAVIHLAQQVARRLGAAGLADTPLPRGYEIRHLDRQWLLVKCDAETGAVKFVASGQESLWTRLGLHTTGLTGEHVLELSADIESGLLDEMAVCIEDRLRDAPRSVAQDPTAEPATGGKLRLVDLGRKSRAQCANAARARG
jgi:hypothetical protein